MPKNVLGWPLADAGLAFTERRRDARDQRGTLGILSLSGRAPMATGFATDRQLEQLVADVRQGVKGAQERLLEHANDRLLRLTRQMLRNYPALRRWETTDDVQQNALVRLYRALSEVEVESARHFLNLAGTQIRRELIDLKRHYFGAQGIAANHHTDHRPADDAGGPLDCGGEPDDLASWTAFHEACSELPTEEREVVTLLYYQGLSQQAAADLLGISLRTVKRRWFSARTLLHERLGPAAAAPLRDSGRGGEADDVPGRRGTPARSPAAMGGVAGPRSGRGG